MLSIMFLYILVVVPVINALIIIVSIPLVCGLAQTTR